MAVTTCAHLDTKSFERSYMKIGSTVENPFDLNKVEERAKPILANHVLVWPHFVHRGIVMHFNDNLLL